MSRRRLAAAAALLLLLTGCSTSSIERHTADLTASSMRATGAIARGVFEGLRRGSPVNLNTATDAQLRKLPGITAERSAAIIAGRPFRSTKDLVRRKILPSDAFDQIKSQVTVQ